MDYLYNLNLEAYPIIASKKLLNSSYLLKIEFDFELSNELVDFTNIYLISSFPKIKINEFLVELKKMQKEYDELLLLFISEQEEENLICRKIINLNTNNSFEINKIKYMFEYDNYDFKNAYLLKDII